MNASGLVLFKPFYFAGETAKVAVTIDAASVSVVYGSSSVALTKTNDTFEGKIETATLIGETHYTVLATNTAGETEAIAHGSFVVRTAGRSKLREVIAAVDEAIKTYGTNPNKSINVGEIAITYKDLSELLAIRSHYEQLAQAEEQGKVLTGGLQVVRVRF